jgi:hypothetical protein
VVRKIICFVLAFACAALIEGPTAAQVAEALPSHVPPPAWYHPTLGQAESALKGQSVGPNSYTRFGKSTITGWKTSGKYTFAITKVTHVSPAIAAAALRTSGVLASWWNPFSWDWGHILGSTWNAIWNNCMKGALAGVSLQATQSVAMKLIDRGARVFVGPSGYLSIAISSCVVAMVFGS